METLIDEIYLSGYTQTPAPARQCFDNLGCLTTGEDFYHPQYRSINLIAEPREVVAVTFKLYTREAPQGFLVPALDVSRILSSSFRADRPTKVVIHGYLNGRDMPWLDVSTPVSCRNNARQECLMKEGVT